MSILQSVNTVFQQILPGHFLSRIAGHLAFCKQEKIKNFLIRQFIKRFGINMDEVAEQSLDAYPHFNSFFTRGLRSGVRPLAGSGCIASPVDGTVFGKGLLGPDTKLTAKGHHFSLAELLGSDQFESKYINGQFLTIYLSPKDYHRVHCPVDAELIHMTHVPGRLFSVNKSTSTSIKAVFARNERVVLHFKSKNGPFVMVFVGAMLVASIATTFAGVITPPGRNLTTWNYHCGPRYRFKQGDEVGLFQYGSTVILISSDEWALNSDIHDGQQTLYGQSVGQMKHKA